MTIRCLIVDDNREFLEAEGITVSGAFGLQRKG